MFPKGDHSRRCPYGEMFFLGESILKRAVVGAIVGWTEACMANSLGLDVPNLKHKTDHAEGLFI